MEMKIYYLVQESRSGVLVSILDSRAGCRPQKVIFLLSRFSFPCLAASSAGFILALIGRASEPELRSRSRSFMGKLEPPPLMVLGARARVSRPFSAKNKSRVKNDPAMLPY